MSIAVRCLIAGLILAVVPASPAVAEIPRVEPLKLASGEVIEPAGLRYIRSENVAPPGTLTATMATNRVVPATTKSMAPIWVTVLGNVENAGTYEMGSVERSLEALWERCGGPQDPSRYDVHLVRGGRCWPGTVSAETRLQDGDLVVLQARGKSKPGTLVTLGLIGLSQKPKAVLVPSETATVERILTLAHQTHLNPAQVKVLVDGASAIPMPKDARLPDCTVLVFNPARVKQNAVPHFPTNIFPLEPSDSIALTAETETAGQSPNARPEQERIAAPASLTPLEIPSGEETAKPPRSAKMTQLSPLPNVENVPPPPTNMPTRTADRSGAVPIGRPATPSHIVRFSPKSFLPPEPPLKVATTSRPRSGSIGLAPVPPELDVAPVGLPVEDSDAGAIGNEDEKGDNLWTIVVSAVLLGVGTFYAIRRFRDSSTGSNRRQTIDQLKDRLGRPTTIPEFESQENDPPELTVADAVELDSNASSEKPGRSIPEADIPDNQSIHGPSAPRSGTMLQPADVLAHLVANRLPFREEAVELPRSLFVQGRSKAPSRRRIDAGGDIAGKPHLDRNEEPTDRWWPSQRVARHGDREGWSHAATEDPPRDLVINPDDRTDYLGGSRDLGTPFEQALAKLRQSR